MSTALLAKTINLPAPISSLDAYIQSVNSIPMLSVEKEQELARELHQHNDLDAARQLVMSHLRFVVHVARSYTGYGLPLGDLIQEGNVGLMKAVKRFDPEQNVRLVSFAVHWIKAEIHEYVLRNWRIVKVATTKAQRKLFFNLRSAKKRLGWMNNQEVEALAQDLGVSTAVVREMESRLSGHDVSFDPAPESDSSEERDYYSPAAYLEDAGADPALVLEREDWEEDASQRLLLALDELDERSRDILQRRWLNEDKPTLHQLAEEYGVSAERIRQIESSAIKKLQANMVA